MDINKATIIYTQNQFHVNAWPANKTTKANSVWTKFIKDFKIQDGSA